MPRIRGRSTAEHIAITAGQLFYRDGIHAVGVELVALEAGVTKRTVYKHFATKEALVACGLRAGGMRFTDELPGTPAERILRVFDRVSAWTAEPGFRGCPYITAAVELANRRHPAHAVAVEAKLRRCAWFRDQLREMGVHDAETIAEQLLLIFDGAIASATVRGPRAAAAARELVQHILEDAAAPARFPLAHAG